MRDHLINIVRFHGSFFRIWLLPLLITIVIVLFLLASGRDNAGFLWALILLLLSLSVFEFGSVFSSMESFDILNRVDNKTGKKLVLRESPVAFFAFAFLVPTLISLGFFLASLYGFVSYFQSYISLNKKPEKIVTAPISERNLVSFFGYGFWVDDSFWSNEPSDQPNTLMVHLKFFPKGVFTFTNLKSNLPVFYLETADNNRIDMNSKELADLNNFFMNSFGERLRSYPDASHYLKFHLKRKDNSFFLGSSHNTIPKIKLNARDLKK
ncbi:MAG: hypothetical protein HQM10_23580 [Candidatus Riflebacteria bacterium]|nr:hypothetical protein [Candidatus Riflebacteria bacterium]